MNRWDTALACAILLVAAVLWIAPFPTGSNVILQGPAGRTAIDLSIDATYVVAGAVGDIEFVVRDGRVSAVRSSCDDQFCVRMGPLASGRPIVCAPNGVIARFERPGGALDAVSR